MVTKAKDYGDTATLEKPLTYEKNTSDSEKRKLKHMMLKVNRGSYNFVKRTIDIVGGSIGCLFLLPIAGVIKIANLASGDKAPILLTQKRIDKGGKEFKFYKFRSMVPNADEELKRLMATDPAIKEEYTKNKKLKHDPRITPVGKVIRRTSIDELPQLINVVKGDMSIVGNRPYLPREKEDMGKYYRVAADSFDLDYDKFIVKGQAKAGSADPYTSRNTRLLNIDETVEKLLTTEYVKRQLGLFR